MHENSAHTNATTQIFTPDTTNAVPIPFSESLISAGFPSSAENFIERTLDINDLLIKHPVSTFYIRVIGDSMINAGINSGDILVVDRALAFTNNKIAVVRINNEFTVKRICFTEDRMLLLAENDTYAPIEITPEMDFEVWGMVTFVIHKV
jgi:DNA polymerase V